MFLLIFFASSLRRWWSVFVFYIENCNFNYYCLASFVASWTISMIMIQFITFKIMIIFFIFHFCMRAFILRWYFKTAFWLTSFFRITEMTKFVRLLILIKLMFEKFIVFWLKIIMLLIITRAIKCCFLHDNFKQYNFLNIKHISHSKKLIFQYWD